MTVPDARKLKDLEFESAKLKKIVAENMLAIECLKEIAAKIGNPCGQTRSP